MPPPLSRLTFRRPAPGSTELGERLVCAPATSFLTRPATPARSSQAPS
jgi:hypothetical protein